jgi:Protein of unknown function (DUF2630)
MAPRRLTMNDRDVVEHISELVAEEHDLRSHAHGGAPLSAEDSERIQQLEVQLDQCWDLLRRRQAREEFGQDPSDEGSVRPASVVERYQQ